MGVGPKWWDWCPYKAMKRPQPCGRRHCPQAKKGVLTRNHIEWHLNLGLQASRTVRNKCPFLKPLSPGYLLCVHVCILSQSCPTLCHPMDCSPPGSSVHGIFQAIVLEWIAISFSRGSSQPRDWTRVSCIVDRCFTIWATREVLRILEGVAISSSRGSS